VARALGAVAPLRLAIKSKSERGYELINGRGSDAEKAADVHLSPDMTSAEAFRVVARNCLTQVVANEPAMARGDGEALHQMRIGLRRLRAAMSTFSSVARDEKGERIKSELKWIARALSPARDLDVLVAEVMAPLRQQHPDDTGVAEICRDIERRRTQARRKAMTAAGSERFRALMLEVAEWIEAGPWSRDSDALRGVRREQPITILATEELTRRRKKIKKRTKVLQDLSAPERHRLRIRAKKLRYGVEFFADLFAGDKTAKRCAAALSSLKELQDALGALNDIATREKLAADLARSGSKRGEARTRVFAAGLIAGSQEARVQQMLQKAAAAATEFLEAKPFWK